LSIASKSGPVHPNGVTSLKNSSAHRSTRPDDVLLSYDGAVFICFTTTPVNAISEAYRLTQRCFFYVATRFDLSKRINVSDVRYDLINNDDSDETDHARNVIGASRSL